MSDPAAQLQQSLAAEGLEVAFLVKPHNVFYLAGYASVCSGVVAFPDQEPVFCILWLDLPEAKQVCRLPRLASYVFPQDSLMARMAAIAAKERPTPRRIGIEKDFMLVRDYELLRQRFPQAEFVHLSPLVDRLRGIKSPQEIELIRRSATIADQGMAAALAAVRPGVSELEVAAEAEYAMTKAGSLRPAFGTFVASGPRTLLAHPHASPRVIQAGEPVVIDLGATYGGYASDLCRTAFAGPPTQAQIDYLRLVAQAQAACAAAVRDGAVAADVWQAAYQVFADRGLGKYLPRDIGYGVGLRQSEFYPVVEKDSRTVLQKNMVLALMQTTAYSKEIGGLRLEDTFLVTLDGCQRLTQHQQDLY